MMPPFAYAESLAAIVARLAGGSQYCCEACEEETVTRSKALTPHQQAAIAWADPLIPHGRLAELLGVTYEQVRHTRHRVWQDGLVCRIYWVTCTYCGGLVASPQWAIRYHPACRLAAKEARRTRSRKKPIMTAAERAEAGRESDRRYYRAHPEKRRAAIARDAERLARTLATATRNHATWTPEEDAVVVACRGPEAFEAAAIGLGRTFNAVRLRAAKLRAKRH
jgi:hypothetical protein